MKRKKLVKEFEQPEIERQKVYAVPQPKGIPVEIPSPVSVPLEEPKKGDVKWPRTG